MRLLLRSNTSNFSFAEEFIGDDAIPPYAILSHTWGADTEEVTFEDLTNGTGEDKPGFKKIQFCGEQARKDGLQYFWIDTCCINKANHAELSQAINSMFRWYRNATRCYVYLSDVSSPLFNTNEEFTSPPWEPDFQRSRWFTRGWTLQELLAPSSVEFFSQEQKRLGDKRSLRRQIYEITGIPDLALQGACLSQFNVNERLSWKEGRHTKLEEDEAYSLLGIFGVYIPPIYGEGTRGAFKRLLDEISKLEKCMKDLRLTDPRDDKKRIEETKGGLLANSYHWILENPDFQRWRDDQQSRLLWIKGDPGKGKTMLLCGIINELHKSIANTALLTYFFCQATDSRINDATAVLRGLLYLLVEQQPSLISHIRKKHDYAGKVLFEDANAWVALTEVFTDVLRDPSLNTTYFIIDALDECVTDLPKLLDFIAKQSPASSRVKWIVSSRNWPDIEERLERAGHKVRLSLELNAESVSTAVSIFIEQKVSQLAQQKKYNERTRDAVLEHLTSNANDTFLWVALVCQNLEATSERNVLKKLDSFPPGLDCLYERMMQQISKSDDAELCKQTLASIALVYRPVTLAELAALVEQLEDIADDPESIREIISLCGSFLTLREETIYFVHQSAKDFLLARAAEVVFPSGREDVHYTIFVRSLKILSRTLQRDMYGLGALGYPVEDVKQPDLDPLAASRYSCIYWVDHLCDSNPTSSAIHVDDLQDGGVIDVFLRKMYLYWLEALSLCKSMPKGVISMAELRLVRRLFQHEEPEWIIIKPAMGDGWSACLQTLEGHSDYVSSVAFSHDSARLASASNDRTVKIWDASSGACLQTLEGHSDYVSSVAFSHDSARLASASDDGTVKIWDASSGACLQTLEVHGGYVGSVAFSHDSTRLASASDDGTVKIWDASSGACLQTLEGHSDYVSSVAFSHDSARLASVSGDRTVKIWDASSGACLQTLEGHSDHVSSVAFSHDSARLASASNDRTVKIWDASSGACLQTLEVHSGYVSSVAFSHDSTRLASASGDRTVKIWDASSGACLQTLEGHNGYVRSVAFSHDSARLASASGDRTVKIWDASSGACLQTLEGHSDYVRSVAFSHDSTRLASASGDRTVKIWDASSGACLQTLEGHSVSSVAFSHDSTRLASVSGGGTVRIWDASSGACLQTLEGHSVSSVAFSHDSTRLASVSGGGTVRIWDASSGACLQTLEGHSDYVSSVAFSHDSARLASASDDGTVKIWDASSGACLQTLEGHSDYVSSVAFSHDSTRLASASNDRTVKIWDASSGACLQTLEIGKVLRNISFGTTGSYLRTEIGTVSISATPLAPSSTRTVIEPQNPRCQGLALSSDGTWITHNSENIVWLPSEYRPSCSAVIGKKIGIGVGSGRVWICKSLT
ncbi:WD40 repeat-like protein [Cenococcum geophilum]